MYDYRSRESAPLRGRADPADLGAAGTVLRRARLALAALVAVAAVGCTNFEDPTTVIDLRVLAVQVEPSEIILDADISDPAMPTVDPANNPPVTMTPLIVDPTGGGRAVTYTIIACPNNPFAAGRRRAAVQGGGAVPVGRRAHHRRQRAVRREQPEDLAADARPGHGGPNADPTASS